MASQALPENSAVRGLNVRGWKVLLACLIAARASAYLFSTLLLQHIGTFTLLALRFIGAFVILAVIFHGQLRKAGKREVIGGLIMGACYFITMFFELQALTLTTNSHVSLMENTAIVIVPFATAFLAWKLPGKDTLLRAVLAFVGVCVLLWSAEGFSFGIGELMAFGAAVFYAAAMVVTGRLSHTGDSFTMGILQIGWMGLLSFVAMWLFEVTELPATPVEWGYLAYLIIVCSGFGFTLQPLCQKHVPTEMVGTMCALNPMVATVLGVVVLGEPLNLQVVIGVVLVVAAVALPENPRRSRAAAEI